MFELDGLEELQDRATYDRDDARQAQDSREDARARRGALRSSVPASSVRATSNRATGTL